MIEILSAFVLGLILVFFYVRRRPKNYPPGPPNLPIIGSIPFLGQDMRKNITKLHQKYGPVFSLNLGPLNWVVICDFKLYKEAMNRDEFLGRPIQPPTSDLLFKDEDDNVRGVMFSNGAEWQEQRRFSLRNLRDLGFGKMSMEHLIHEEVTKCVNMIKKDLKTSPGKKVSLQFRLNVAILNALWHIVTGQKLEYDDPNLQEIVNKVNIMMTGTQVGGPMFIFPWLRHIIPDQIGFTNVKSMFEEVYKIIGKSFDEHLEKHDSNEVNDFMDAFINKMNSAEQEPNSSFHGQKGKDNLFAGVINLFVGGSETTSNTLNWALFHLSKNLELQSRAVAEIQKVVGKNRLPSLEYRPEMPLVEAIVMETHRMSALAYSGIPRQVVKDTTLGEFFLPKGTRVMTGIYEIMHDQEYWGDPEVFRPERFLDQETGKFKGSERLVPFGLGKRMCIGSTLAQNELFVFLTSFLQEFEFSDPTPDNIEPVCGFVLGCPDFQMNITERN